MKSSLPSSPLNPPPLAPITTTTTTDNNISEQAGDGQAMGRYFLNLPSTLTEPVIGYERLDTPSVASAEPGVIATCTHDDGTKAEGGTVAQESTGGKTVPAEEVEKLRGAVDAQLLLNQQRERLARQQKPELPTRLPSPKTDRKRVSPILEEDSPPLALPASPGGLLTTGLLTTSTDSARTTKGPVMASTPKQTARTPSYPFPPMPIGTPKSLSLEFHKPFTTLSPVATPSGIGAPGYSAPKDRLISGPTTPASSMAFLPLGVSPPKGNLAYRSPNLYDVTLALNSEPGLDSWWTNVVQVMRDDFKADRVTLAVPADTTDLENVPWGQKATFNVAEEDEYSLTYLQRDGIEQPSACGTEEPSLGSLAGLGVARKENAMQGTTHVPPGSETSACGSDEKKKDSSPKDSEVSPQGSKSVDVGSAILSSAGEPPQARLQPAKPLSESLEQPITSEQANFPGYSDIPRDRELRGRILPVLQVLDFEAEPLIESSGIIKVLERGKVVVLSREYSEPAGPTEKIGIDPESQRAISSTPRTPAAVEQAEMAKSGRSMSQMAEMRPRSLSLLSNRGPRHSRSGSRSHPSDGPKSFPGASARSDEASSSPTPLTMYSEYEQFPSSPWSQSPAPSPAIRSDPTENPFFTDAKVNEESFNPTNAPQDYSLHQEVEAIGVDKASTVIHVPLIHPLLSKTHQQSRLSSSAVLEADHSVSSENTPFRPFIDVRKGSAAGTGKDKRTPIAVLSILSPVIPYPSNLVNSLTYLAPHLATSFSLSRHYTNIEAEAAGRQHRRHGVPHRLSPVDRAASGDSQTAKLSCLEELVSTSAEEGCSISVNGSVTSPSEYSVSKSSPGDSLVGTPGWDPVGLGLSGGVRSTVGTPGFHASSEAVDSYFPSRRRGLSRSNSELVTTGPAPSQYRQPSQSPIADRKQTEGLEPVTQQGDDSGPSVRGHSRVKKSEYPISGDDVTAPKDKTDVTGESAQTEGALVPGFRDEVTSQKQPEQLAPQRRPMPRTGVNQVAQRPHSFLHSYGADFNATFQSLASTSSVPRTTTSRTGHSRSGSAPAIGLYEMPPPSERLLRTIIDSIPVQIFTAAPQSGTITWVNSRFLTYRGQTVEDFIKAPWQSIHDDDREEYLGLWSQALRNGEQFSHQVRIRRFDGSYRWFYVRAAPLRDTRGLTVHWFGTNMDIHEQHLAEIDLARQKETAASEAKYRALANSSPQIVFAATEGEGITFVNTQWLTYSGQRFRDALSLGFMEHVHPDDLSKCKLPFLHELLASPAGQAFVSTKTDRGQAPTPGLSAALSTAKTEMATEKEETTWRHAIPDDLNIPTPGLSKLANTGIIKVSRDSEGNPTYSTEVRLRSKEGEYRWHLVRCIIVDSKTFGDGECLWFGTCTDINDHKLLEKKLKETMDSKTRFLSNMSHEIRTPLIGISGMVKFLLDTPLTPEQLDYCHTISTSSEGLLLVINDILDLSKVDAGMMKLSHEWFHIRSLIEDANELLSTMAIQKRLELSYIVDEDVPSAVKGDRVRLRQVLLNIIGNAIKFTSVGEVFSRCQIHRDRDIGSNEIMLSFEVTDTGPGFSEKEAELIFKPFSQIDGSSTRQHGGSGLGLVISRQLVELHGGKLKGSSVEGKGSTFLFTAKFSLPNEQDGPISPTTRPNIRLPTSSEGRPRFPAEQESTLALRAKALTQSPLPFITNAEHGGGSPVLASSGSSDPSIRSHRTHRSERSSMSSVMPDSIASVQDNSVIQLALPPVGMQKKSGTPSPPSSELTLKTTQPIVTPRNGRNLHPPLYSILVLSEQPYSREATTRHIATTLPKDIPHQITPRGSFVECQRIIGGDDPVIFTHIIVSLGDADEIIALIHQIFQSAAHALTSIVILSDPLQRAEILQLAPEYDFDQLHKDKRVQFVYKPIKPSRFAAIFDPELERDLSTDRNRSSAERVAESQKQIFVDMEKNVGNKGHRVLLVEDNPVNQKVLLKFLGKVGLRVETAVDGMECIDKIFHMAHGYYSVVLCDLHMPRKDGYQTCREIRQWERKNDFPTLPIIALSANVMSDVVDRCVQAGFNSYVTKPVDFKELSKAMTDLLDPVDPRNPPVLLRRS